MLDKTIKAMKTIKIFTTVVGQKKAICLISLFFIFVVSVYAQANTPPKGKLQAMFYPKSTMIGVGYVDNNKFVENQNMTFLDASQFRSDSRIDEKNGTFYIRWRNYSGKVDTPVSSLNTIVSGVYFIKNDTAYIEGTQLFHSGKREGLFQISTLTTEKKTSQVVPLVQTTSYDPNMVRINIVDIYSEVYHGYSSTATLQKQSENYILKIKFDDRILETLVSYDMVKQCDLYDYGCFIKNAQDVRLSFIKDYGRAYKNGDTFVGVVEKDSWNQYSPRKGEYRYTTGEIYTGIIESTAFQAIKYFRHEQGKTVFADGVTVNGDWTKQYNFMSWEWEKISENSKSPTELRDMAIKLKKEKEHAEEVRRKGLDREFYAKYPSVKPKFVSTQKKYFVMRDLFPQFSNIKAGMSYQDLKMALPLELYDKVVNSTPGKQVILLTPNERKIFNFLLEGENIGLKIRSEVEIMEAEHILTVGMILEGRGKSWAEGYGFPTITLLNDKVYSVLMAK